jgi:large subunit ribosomal protein L10
MAKKKEAKKEIAKRDIPEYKLKIVADLVSQIKKKRTLLIASTKGLPSSQFHEIKKNFRGKADITVAKKSAVLRAIEVAKKGNLKDLSPVITSDVALFFSDVEPFELSGMLSDSLSPTKAKAGDIAPEDINIEPGPTSLVPGPAISELSGVGLKVSVEGGKLAIKLPHTVAYKGDVIKANVASVLAKLDIKPMKVGFEPVAAYDATNDRVYVGIKIDKKKAYEELREAIGKAIGFAVGRVYLCADSLRFILAKAAMQGTAIENLYNKSQSVPTEAEVSAIMKTTETPSTDNQINTTQEDK